MPGKSAAASVGWNVLFALFCLAAAVSLDEPWQRALLVVLAGAAVAYGVHTARERGLLSG